MSTERRADLVCRTGIKGVSERCVGAFCATYLLRRGFRACGFAWLCAVPYPLRRFRAAPFGLGLLALAVVMIANAQFSAASCAEQCATRADLTSRAQPAIELPRELGIKLPERPTVISVRVNAYGNAVSAVMLISSGMAILDRQAKIAAMRSQYTSATKRCVSALRTYCFTQRWDIFNNN